MHPMVTASVDRRCLVQALREFLPPVAEALIDERDEYMVKTLRSLEGRTVAVVGLAHLDGIERRFQVQNRLQTCT